MGVGVFFFYLPDSPYRHFPLLKGRTFHYSIRTHSVLFGLLVLCRHIPIGIPLLLFGTLHTQLVRFLLLFVLIFLSYSNPVTCYTLLFWIKILFHFSFWKTSLIAWQLLKRLFDIYSFYSCILGFVVVTGIFWTEGIVHSGQGHYSFQTRAV